MAGGFMVTIVGGYGAKRSKSAMAENISTNHDGSKPLSILDFVVSALRKSMVSKCRQDQEAITPVHQMEIGWPTDVRHVTHVTFDKHHGFLGLPIECEVEIPFPCGAPSASASVCGVSARSMQWSYDTRCNSVPTILLLMQERLYALGGLKAEGIFRINPANGKEELARAQLERGIVPQTIDVHCLAGLIKAWFRELPGGVLDGLSSEQLLQCNNKEDKFVELIKQLKPTDSCLLEWAVDLMADVVELEESNKMNARNIAMVFAPNMTKFGKAPPAQDSPKTVSLHEEIIVCESVSHDLPRLDYSTPDLYRLGHGKFLLLNEAEYRMSDALTALVHAVQVTNLLETLILKKLRERNEAAAGSIEKDEESYCEYDTGSDGESTSRASDNEENESENEDRFVGPLDEVEREDGFRKQLERILCSPGNNIGWSAFSAKCDEEESRLKSIAFGCKKRRHWQGGISSSRDQQYLLTNNVFSVVN